MRPCLPKSPQSRKPQATKALELKREARQHRRRKSNKRSVHVATNLQTLRKRLRQRASVAQTSLRGSFVLNFQPAQRCSCSKIARHQPSLYAEVSAQALILSRATSPASRRSQPTCLSAERSGAPSCNSHMISNRSARNSLSPQTLSPSASPPARSRKICRSSLRRSPNSCASLRFLPTSWRNSNNRSSLSFRSSNPIRAIAPANASHS